MAELYRGSMPEGDTIKILAARLARVLVGKEVRAFESHVIADDVARTVVGKRVSAVEARGKNLLVRFDDGRALHVHLRMLGRIRVDPSVKYMRFRPQLLLSVDGAVVTGRRIPVLRLLSGEAAERRAPDLATLGPDLLADDFDEAEALRRLRSLGARPIAEALLVQSALAGIGNVYKSETLFMERVDPRTPVRELDDARLTALVRRARSLLKLNTKLRGPRRTRSSLAGPRVWVYDRAGRACLVCKTPIARIHQGGRSTYHCPTCQR
jgi:endonuclease-8